MKETINLKKEWKDFSKEEKKNLEISVLLIGLLYEICKIEFIIQSKNKQDVNHVNVSAINDIEKKSHKFL